jgi:chromosome segregation ATPase
MDVVAQGNPSILLRERKLLGGWKIKHNEYPRCAADWLQQREASQQRFKEVSSDIHQNQDLEKKNAAFHEKRMLDLHGNMEAQISVLQKRVFELQEEKKDLLKDVDRLKSEIDVCMQTHAEKVETLKIEKAQLLRECEDIAGASFSSLQNAVSELSTRIDGMKEAQKDDQLKKNGVWCSLMWFLA